MTKQRRNELFGLSEAKQPEAEQPKNPYLNLDILKEDEKEMPEVGRLNTPNDFRIDPVGVNPVASAVIDDAVKRRSRRSDKFLVKPGTAQSHQSAMGTRLSGFGEARKETPDPNAGSLYHSHSSAFDLNDPEPAPLTRPISEVPLKRAVSMYPGESVSREQSRQTAAFLRESTETAVRVAERQKFDNAASVLVGRNVQSKATFGPGDELPERQEVDILQFEDIEITGNMSRHQMVEVNNKLKNMLETIKTLQTENQHLAAIGKDFEGEKAKATGSLKEELTKTKEELDKLQKKYDEEVAKAREDANKRVDETQAKYRSTIEILEEEKKQQQELHRKEVEREKEKLCQLHKLEVEELGKINTKQLEGQRAELEAEIEMLKKQLQKKEDLNKITLQVDSLVDDLKNRMEADIRSKNLAFSDKEQALDDERRKLAAELEKVEVKKKDLDERMQKLAQKERQIEAEAEDKKKLSLYNKDLFELQHKEALKELETRQAKYLDDHKKLELEKAQFEKDRNEWELHYKDQKGSLTLDLNAFQKEKQDFIQFTMESNR